MELQEVVSTFELTHYELLAENDFNGHQRKTLIIDIDGTICSGAIQGDYSKCIPIEKM